MTLDLSIASLARRYAARDLTPSQLVESLLAARHTFDAHNIWISDVPDEALRARGRQLDGMEPDSLPLYGIPFAIKDNIDLAGLPTTAACPAFAYQPASSAPVVQALIDAGAIALGKTNLDQFATGLVGTRSPHGACRNAFDPQYLSGGSSSGSAVAVALGLASFALGTDTAGSGRVPAAFNNLVGYKPTLGLLSMRGVVPACRSLDTVSVFALTAEDADRVRKVAARFDAGDPWSRPLPRAARRGWGTGKFRFGVPRGQLEFFGNDAYARLFIEEVSRLEALGGAPHEVDITPLLDAARLLYEGPWVAERYLATESLLASDPAAMLPVTRGIIQGGAVPRALDAFRASYRLQELKRAAAPLWEACDLLLLPTAATHYRIAEVEADPVALNSNLGRYTNFVNLMDLAAVAVPAGFTPAGLPFGVSLIAAGGSDADLLSLAGRAQRAAVNTLGASRLPLPPAPPASAAAPDGLVDVMVCGAHMSGLPLNPQLLERGASCMATTRTAPVYRFYALPGGPPFRPGLVQVRDGGVAIDVEVWRMPLEHFGSFVAGIPAPLGIGKVRLEDGSLVSGFLCEGVAVAGAEDISALGGWRQYLRR
jgi:allophanate hydrolase